MPKKQNHAETINFLIKSIIILVVIIGIGLVAIALGRNKNSISQLDQRELEAFESVFSKAITNEFSDEERRTAATVTGLGLSQDDDLYADFTIYSITKSPTHKTQRSICNANMKTVSQLPVPTTKPAAPSPIPTTARSKPQNNHQS